jgi:hypothetical protein
MRARFVLTSLLVAVLLSLAASPAADAGFQPIDDEVPHGNPVIGSDLPGDIEPEANTTNYLLWAALGSCLVGAGVLLVKVERWEARRVTGEPPSAPALKLGR